MAYSKLEAYSKPWYIQNPIKHLRWNVLRIQLTAMIIFASYNYFRNIIFSLSHDFFLCRSNFYSRIIYRIKKIMGWRRGSREVNFGILYRRYRYIKKCHVILCLTRCFYSEKLYYYPLIIPILNTNNFEQAIIS